MGVYQRPFIDYDIADTQLTFFNISGIPTDGSINIILVFLGFAAPIGVVSDNAISTSKIVTGAVTETKLGFNTFGEGYGATRGTLTIVGSTVTPDFLSNQYFDLNVGGNFTLNLPSIPGTNIPVGATAGTWVIDCTNTGVGPWTFTAGTGMTVIGGSFDGTTGAKNRISIHLTSATTAAVSFGFPIVDSGSGFRNKIINGNFDIWQRGTSLNDNGYLADRWMLSTDGASYSAQSQQIFAVGQTAVPNNPTYFIRWSTTNAAVTGGLLQQKIEDVRTLAGSVITISYYAKASSTIMLTYVGIFQNFGSGGSVDVNNNVSNPPMLTTTWQKYTHTITLASISEKIVGTGSHLRLVFRIPDNIITTVDIAQVQLEEGPVATPFEHRPIGTELALCQRYFQIIDVLNYSYGSTGSGQRFGYPISMRTTPAVLNPSLTLDNASSASIITYSARLVYLNYFVISVGNAQVSGSAWLDSEL